VKNILSDGTAKIYLCLGGLNLLRTFRMSGKMMEREIYVILGVPHSLGALDLLYLIQYAYIIYTYVVIQ